MAKQLNIKERNKAICGLYESKQFTTEQIAKNYDISPRQVQRIVGAAGVLRSAAESNKVVAPLKRYHRIPSHLKVKHKHLTAKRRFELISAHPYCANCGSRPADGVRLEVDHKDEDPANNEADNLQVLCTRCNLGKSHLTREAA